MSFNAYYISYTVPGNAGAEYTVASGRLVTLDVDETFDARLTTRLANTHLIRAVASQVRGVPIASAVLEGL